MKTAFDGHTAYVASLGVCVPCECQPHNPLTEMVAVNSVVGYNELLEAVNALRTEEGETALTHNHQLV